MQKIGGKVIQTAAVQQRAKVHGPLALYICVFLSFSFLHCFTSFLPRIHPPYPSHHSFLPSYFPSYLLSSSFLPSSFLPSFFRWFLRPFLPYFVPSFLPSFPSLSFLPSLKYGKKNIFLLFTDHLFVCLELDPK